MKKHVTLIGFILIFTLFINAQEDKAGNLPVRGFCIEAPRKDGLDLFLKFISEDLKQMNVNTLVLRIDWNYDYKSHPELRDENPLTLEDVKKLVSTCNEAQIELIPQINLFGHQSWHETVYALLREYPEFDETPHIAMPEKFEWPNDDGLYCKSYCPEHPDLHKIVFALIDEIMEVFEASSFHAGLDEVFYIGDEHCPRCAGIDPAKLFSDEVWRIRNHLASKSQSLWIWGDRLIDGKITGMGMWEASMNNTARAIDMIPKDVVICDWHYERADHTAPYFAMKGLNVITCPYRNSEVAIEQLNNLMDYRAQATPELSGRYLGMMQTIWSPASRFLASWYSESGENLRRGGSAVDCFRALFNQMKEED